jgi:hypothetical protein
LCFRASNEITLAQITPVIAEVLYKHRKISSTEITKVRLDGDPELIDGLAVTGLINNSRSRAVNAKKLGWKPIHEGFPEFCADISNSVDYVLAQDSA